MCENDIAVLSGKEDVTKHVTGIVAIEAATFNPPWTENDFQTEIDDNNSRFLLLVNNGLPVGYLFAKQVTDEICLNKLCVDREWRGRGWGNLLLRNCIERHRHASRRIYLEVATTNTSAVALYRGCGFVVGRVRKKIYASGADAFEMVYEYPEM